MDTRPILILGAGAFAIEVADLISETPGFTLAGFVQSVEPGKPDQTLEGLPVYWVEDAARLAGTHWAVCAVGTSQRKGFIEQVASFGMRFATVIHPAARVSPKSAIGEGSIVSAGVMIGTHTRVGRHVILNRGVLVGHHTDIGDYVTIGPGANIAGSCSVGDSAFIGIGAIIRDHIKVGARAVLGAGAVVVKEVPEAVMVIAARVTTME
ncbi:MAG: acetyltransferase [Bryobacteraceae bacterium]|nr:acetyltransferase [Bryobacteraceae bacterium]